MTTILITGATGFLGEYVIRRLFKSRSEIRAFVRPTSDIAWLSKQDVHLFFGDLSQDHAIQSALQGVDLLINVASLGFGHAPNIVNSLIKSEVRRAVFVSSTSIFSKLSTRSKVTRIQAELVIAESGLDYTIVRPSMIYGSPRDRNIWRLVNFIKKWPIVPIIGRGDALQQPVYVDDVAQAIVSASQRDRSIGQSYDIAGAEAISFLDIINLVSAALGRSTKKVHIPYVMAKSASLLFGSIGLGITFEQVLRFGEEKTFDISAASRDLGYKPLVFEDGLAHEIQWLRKL